MTLIKMALHQVTIPRLRAGPKEQLPRGCRLTMKDRTDRYQNSYRAHALIRSIFGSYMGLSEQLQG